MSFISRVNQIEQLDSLIRRKGTGSARELASKLQISERNVFNLLDLMKSLGASIYFCKSSNSYCYKTNIRFKFGFVSNGELHSFKGGRKNFFSMTAIFFQY